MSKPTRAYETRLNELLQTKFARPRLHTPSVSRDALLSALDQGLEGKLTLLTAPAGYGKTTLASLWTTRSTAGIHTAWLALDENDDDPVRFWRYVVTAGQKFDQASGRSALRQLHLSQDINFEAILTVWINDMSRASGRNVLVLDNYHFIQSSQIHGQVSFLVDHLPANMHVVLLARAEPPLPLARLRAQGELLELRATDLRFSLEETSDLLRDALPYSLPPETISYLHERADGWAAGLHLIALMLRFKPSPKAREQFLAEFSGSLRPILDYLVSDVLNTQPEEIQTFLLKTSMLNRLTGPLCDAVLDRTGSEEILGELERANLFILPMDEKGQWYHYHALFAEAVQHEAILRYGQETIRSIYRQASSWYERHGMLADAVEASLSAQDYPSTALLLRELAGQDNFAEGRELHNLRRWLENLPEQVIRRHAELCFLYARVLLFTREQSTTRTATQIEELLRNAESAWELQGNLAKLGEALAFRAVAALFRGEYTRAGASARQALSQLPEDNLTWRSIGLNVVAMDDLMAGRLNAAYQILSQSLQLCEMSGNPFAARGTMVLLGYAQAGRGELHQAAELYGQVLASAREDRDLTDQARALSGLAELAYEWNSLDEAQEQAEQALQVGIQIRDERLRVQPTLLLARISLARGQHLRAQEQIAAALAGLQPHRLPALYREVLACQALLQLSTGNLEAVQKWIENRSEFEMALPIPQLEQEELLIARFLIRRAKSKEALTRLDLLESSAQEAGRIRTVLVLRLVKAAAYIVNEDTTAAGPILHEVLTLAVQEGFQRMFMDEGDILVAPLQSLLPAVQENALIHAYLHSLLAAFAQQEQEGSSQDLSIDLADALTPQEERILILFAGGSTKQEIADQLFISVNTVKTHLKRVYQKLTISSRAEARQSARRLNLLQ